MYRMSAALLLVFLAGIAAAADSTELVVERLTWAGVKLVHGNTTVLIDAVGKDLWNGQAPEGLVPVVADTPRRYALVTHTHNDHFDPETLRQQLGERGYVICHESLAAHIASRGLRVIPVRDYQPLPRGGLVFTAVPASDGLGDSQVSWIVTSPKRRILHAGDTLWHGQWDLLGAQYGPFDAVFLPINGARVAREPSSAIPAVMGPAQAVDAALLLRSQRLVPIHFGLTDPPHYVEVEQPLQQAKTLARERGLHLEHLAPGQVLAW